MKGINAVSNDVRNLWEKRSNPTNQKNKNSCDAKSGQ